MARAHRQVLTVISTGILVLASLSTSPIGAWAQSRALAYQLTYTQDYDPAPSPDGKTLVFIKQLDGQEQLFTMDIDGRGQRQLTHDEASHEDPAWSPDGKSIVFVYVKGDSEIISLISADGSGFRRISPANEKAIHPHWSPDGARVIYCTDDDLAPPRKNNADIRVIELATGKITTLITGGVNTYPSWSPDGKHVAFRRMVQEINSEVFIADADGTNARNLTNHPAFDGWPAWSPDGSQIAFASNRNSSYQIFVMKADGSGVRLLASTEGRATSPQWSRDGARIYFPICRNVDFGNQCEIYAVRTDGFVR